jgi:hypothetical protein
MNSTRARSGAERRFPLSALTLVLAAAVLLLWLSLREDAPRGAILPGCAPIDENPPAARPAAIVQPVAVPVSAPLPAPAESPAAAAPSTAEEVRDEPVITRVQGFVVDARTREAVPEIEILLRSGEATDRVRTQADGSFSSTKNFAAGTLSAMLFDDGKNVARFEREHRAGALEIGWQMDVPIGPTYPIQISGAEADDVASWSARIVETIRDPENAGEIEVTVDGLRMAADLEKHPDRNWTWIPLRPGNVPWIRYASVEFEPDASYPLRLELRRDVPALDGTSLVRSTIGIHPVLVVRAIASPLTANLQGAIQTDEHRSRPEVEVMLLPYDIESGVTIHSNVWDRTTADAMGGYRFRRVRPGDKVLIAFADNHVLERRTLRLFPGENPAPEIRLVRALQDSVQLNLGAAGSSEDDGSRRPGLVVVRLRLAETGGAARGWLAYDLVKPGRSVFEWRCSVQDLPAAEFELSEIGLYTPPAWKPFEMKVLTPHTRLDLAASDAREAKTFRFDVNGSGTNSPEGNGARHRRRATSFSSTAYSATPYSVSFGPGGSYLDAGTGGRDRRWTLPADVPLEWAVWSEGCAPQFGTDADFGDGDSGRVAKIELGAGWGAALYLRTGRPSSVPERSRSANEPRLFPPVARGVLTAPPLSQVTVVADREPVATTDVEGAARLSLTKPPHKLLLHCEGWHLTKLERLSLTERPSAIQNYVGWMERD